ncbi:MAG: OsmC-related (seleno)protein, partial [Acidimicrobiia bacterium]|nr:OsmC-related (seleno)protein [Acidimicrobiia bacterium]
MAESPFRIERTDDGTRFTFELRAEKAERQRKRAVFAHFEMFCDEGEALGGDDTAPPPLAYF